MKRVLLAAEHLVVGIHLLPNYGLGDAQQHGFVFLRLNPYRDVMCDV